MPGENCSSIPGRCSKVDYLGLFGNGVPVPTHYWKVIYDPANQEAIAFIFPHQRILTSQLPALLVSVDEVEIRSGLNFFTPLPDTTEETLEAQQPVGMWSN